jgi:predicted amidophosphoribosyltransferase
LWGGRFNQSATLAGAISGQCGVPVLHDALKRVRATPQQRHRAQRRQHHVEAGVQHCARSAAEL